MTAFNDAELIAALGDIESDRIERKESLNGDSPDRVRQAVCAFANDLPDHREPGVVFVGAKDDGSPAGLPITDQLLLQLSDIRSDGNILPLPSMIVEKRKILGVDMAVVTVHPSDAPPVRFKGRIWVRVGPRRGIASSQDERILNEKRRFRDLPFDLQPVLTARLADLSRLAFEEEYLPGAVAADVLASNDRTYPERLAACRMIDSVSTAVPTVMGCLALGTRPRDLLACDYVQFLRINGTELHQEITDEETIDGRIGDIVRRLDEKLESHIRTGVDITSETVESRSPDYPVVALQQLTRNAIMHRTYESTNAPIRVTWFSDRIEILSPGGPFGLVTRQNFGDAGVADYRNPNLAEALKVLGYVQRFGVGISLARKALEANGNPPLEFQVEDNFVLAILRRRP